LIFDLANGDITKFEKITEIPAVTVFQYVRMTNQKNLQNKK